MLKAFLLTVGDLKVLADTCVWFSARASGGCSVHGDGTVASNFAHAIMKILILTVIEMVL